MKHVEAIQFMNRIYDLPEYEDILSEVKLSILTENELAIVPSLVNLNYIRVDDKKQVFFLTEPGTQFLFKNKISNNQKTETMATKSAKKATSKKTVKKASSKKAKSAAPKVKKEKAPKKEREVVEVEHKGKKIKAEVRGKMTDKRNGNVYTRYYDIAGGVFFHQKIN